MTNKKIFTALLLLLCMATGRAQVRFLANPVAISRNADALLSIVANSVYNSAVEGSVSIRVTEENTDRPVMTILFNRVVLLPGSNNLSRFREQVSRNFYDNELSRIAANTGMFAPGNYSICCLFSPDDKLLPGINNEQCFVSLVTPRTPINLIYPVDSICNFRPPFSWQGRKTAGNGVAFKVICTEVEADQSPEEALQNNFPVINEVLYRQANQIPFPMGSAALKEGKKYAWQVLEVAGENLLNNSEIYEFTVSCKMNTETGVESFAEVKPVYTAKTYHFTSTINFSFTNPYVAGKLQYAIVHVPSLKKMTNLPEVEMAAGLNKIILNTEDIKGIRKNELYKIEVYGIGTGVHYINFMIKE